MSGSGRHDSLAEINAFLSQHPNAVRSSAMALSKVLRAFVQANGDAAISPNLRSPVVDETDALCALTADPKLSVLDDLALLLVWVIKILSRKEVNRIRRGDALSSAVLVILKGNPANSQLCRECANCVLNLCYERANVTRLLDGDALALLLPLLSRTDDIELISSALGALQSLCYQPIGREKLHASNGTAPVSRLLQSPHAKIVDRTIGVIHNLSAYPPTIRVIRECLGIEPLIRALGSANSLPQRINAAPTAVAVAAAGALQNMAREFKSRDLILEGGAVKPLTELLFSGELDAQTAAAGTLLNLLGPEPAASATTPTATPAIASSASVGITPLSSPPAPQRSSSSMESSNDLSLDVRASPMLHRSASTKSVRGGASAAFLGPMMAALESKKASVNSLSKRGGKSLSSSHSTPSLMPMSAAIKAAVSPNFKAGGSKLSANAQALLAAIPPTPAVAASSAPVLNIQSDETLDDQLPVATRDYAPRVAFKNALSDALVMGILYNVLFEGQDLDPDHDE